MKPLLTILLAPLAVLAFGNAANAQGNTTVELPAIAVASRCGQAVDPGGAGIPHVIVVLSSSDWKRELRSIEANDDGKFCLPRAVHKAWLKLLKPGFNETRISVTLKRRGRDEFAIKLSLGT